MLIQKNDIKIETFLSMITTREFHVYKEQKGST